MHSFPVLGLLPESKDEKPQSQDESSVMEARPEVGGGAYYYCQFCWCWVEGSSNSLVGRVVSLKGSRIPDAPQTIGKQEELQERAY